jgi:hypothetical protein
MPPPTRQPLSESTLLTRYLLLPSSLPTILPFNTFLSLVPASARNNEDLRPHLRRLYADLQTQRNIDLATVRNNIARECARAGTVKAQLRRDLARELDGLDLDDADGNGGDAYIIDLKRESSVELGSSRKRKRTAEADNDEDPDASSASEAPSPPASNVHEPHSDKEHPSDEAEDEDEIPESPSVAASHSTSRSSSLINVLTSPPPPTLPPSEPPTTLTNPTETARLDTLLDLAFHGPRGLALPSSANPAATLFPSGTATAQHHSKDSLLNAMETAVTALQREIESLEKERGEVMAAMKETVGGLSDLRYGSFGGRGAGAGGGGGSGGGGSGAGVEVEVEVERGLRTLREVVERKVADL